MLGYDIDGTLASEVKHQTKWRSLTKAGKKERNRRKIQYFRHAKVLIMPTQKFIAITGRKGDPETVAATTAWLKHNFGNLCLKAIFPIKTQSYAGVAHYKARMIRENKIHVYFENSKKTAKGIKRLCPKVKVVVVKKGAVLYEQKICNSKSDN